MVRAISLKDANYNLFLFLGVMKKRAAREDRPLCFEGFRAVRLCFGLLALNLVHWTKFSAEQIGLEAHSTHAAHVWHTAAGGWCVSFWGFGNRGFGCDQEASD